MEPSLDSVVMAAAAELMAATKADLIAVCERVLAHLVDQLGIDTGFLRFNDHVTRTTTLVAQWPPRDHVPDPDPIGVVHFAEADQVFAMAEHLKTPTVLRPGPENERFQRRIHAATGVVAVSLACVPLRSGNVTTGTLGFVKYGDRDWTAAELNPLQTIAALFAQLQARIAAEEQLGFITDDLTGLLHRRALITHLDDRLREGEPGPVSVLYLDLDRLKAINDYLGHDAGDWYIKVFAQRLREDIATEALAARVGGDEFVVVPAAAMGVEAASEFAHRLQTRLHQHVVIDSAVLARTVSIGVAVGVPGHDTTSDLLRRADQAGLAAKQAGRSKIAVLTPDESAENAARDDVALHLADTLDSDGGALILHYLPEVDMRTGRILGVEALARWHHPTRGLLLPASFIGVAESINRAATLGRLVMRTACADFRKWRSTGVGHDITLSINVSPVQLLSTSFAESVADTLDEFEIPAAALRLEITEGVVVLDIDSTRRTLGAVRDIGVNIAIDDFGTGFSGFTHLKSLPVDSVKIDGRIVTEIVDDAGDLAIVRAILALGEAFGLDVVAEGVETPAVYRALLNLGCLRAQGFLLSRPADATTTEGKLATGILAVPFE